MPVILGPVHVETMSLSQCTEFGFSSTGEHLDALPPDLVGVLHHRQGLPSVQTLFRAVGKG